ncbi:MAG TPA: hypothetical protein VKP11_12985, partial [Frankiaceae bacterium]|nr:hypothetical protein [Frankiaceae bacterium]
MPRAFRGIGREHVADVLDHADLDHAEEQEQQQRADEHELHDRRPAVVRARTAGTTAADPTTASPTGRRFHPAPVTLSMAFVNASRRAGVTIVRRATTSAAVITVIMTHPGTSPRSSRGG